MPDLPFFSTHLFAEELYEREDRMFPEMATLLPELKAAGYRLSVITNNYFMDKEHTRTALYIKRYLHLFDSVCSSSHDSECSFEHVTVHVIESCRVGLRKPDRRIFELALEQLQVAADEAVFCDDLEVNLTMPRELGMRTIHVSERISYSCRLQTGITHALR